MPSTNKYLKFKNLQNTIQRNFIVYADIESQMIFNDNVYNHEHLMSGYYLHCINKKYSKKVKLFDKLEDFRDNLINELDYIKNINENKLNFDIDMKSFNKKEFENVKICKHCNYNFDNNYNNRKITLIEKVDKYKLQRIIDDFDNNNINKETEENLKKYYKNLNDCCNPSFTVTASACFVKQRRNEIYSELRKYKLHNHFKSIQRCDWRRKYCVNLNAPITAQLTE